MLEVRHLVACFFESPELGELGQGARGLQTQGSRGGQETLEDCWSRPTGRRWRPEGTSSTSARKVRELGRSLRLKNSKPTHASTRLRSQCADGASRARAPSQGHREKDDAVVDELCARRRGAATNKPRGKWHAAAPRCRDRERPNW